MITIILFRLFLIAITMSQPMNRKPVLTGCIDRVESEIVVFVTDDNKVIQLKPNQLSGHVIEGNCFKNGVFDSGFTKARRLKIIKMLNQLKKTGSSVDADDVEIL